MHHMHINTQTHVQLRRIFGASVIASVDREDVAENTRRHGRSTQVCECVYLCMCVCACVCAYACAYAFFVERAAYA
jgi:hypothetical protein